QPARDRADLVAGGFGAAEEPTDWIADRRDHLRLPCQAKPRTAPRMWKRTPPVTSVYHGSSIPGRTIRRADQPGGSPARNRASTGTCSAVASAFVWLAMAITAISSPCCAAVMPRALAAAVCE